MLANYKYLVIGETPAAAKAGAEAVDVKYQVLDHVVDCAKAQKRGAPKIHSVAEVEKRNR